MRNKERLGGSAHKALIIEEPGCCQAKAFCLEVRDGIQAEPLADKGAHRVKR